MQWLSPKHEARQSGWPGAFSIGQGEILGRRNSFSHIQEEQNVNPPVPSQAEAGLYGLCLAEQPQALPEPAASLSHAARVSTSAAGGQRRWKKKK